MTTDHSCWGLAKSEENLSVVRIVAYGGPKSHF